MKITLYTAFAIISLLAIVSPAVVAGKQSQADSGKAILVLDASGSMWGKIGNQHKIEIAREAVAEMVESWDSNLELGLMTYGHRRKGDCADIEMLIAPQTVKPAEFVATANAINPKGKTPLSQAVINAAKALQHTEQKATVILISDGRETCELDPCEVGAQLAAQGIDFTAHVIGFDVPQQDLAGLQCLAKQTGGIFIQATNTQELKDALQETRKVSVRAPDLKLGAATIIVPDEVTEGSRFIARWTGPKNLSDYLVIRSADRKQRFFGASIGSQIVGSEVELTAPANTGDYIVYYEVSSEHEPLGQAALKVVPAVGSLSLDPTHQAGSPMAVDWTGPGISSDEIVVYKKGGSDPLYRIMAGAGDPRQATINAPVEAGEYELRLESKNKVLAKEPFKVIAVTASIRILTDNIQAGKPLLVEWDGPRNKGDRLVIAITGSTRYLSQRPASGTTKSPIKLRLSTEPGKYETRLQTSSGKVLAKQEFVSR